MHYEAEEKGRKSSDSGHCSTTMKVRRKRERERERQTETEAETRREVWARPCCYVPSKRVWGTYHLQAFEDDASPQRACGGVECVKLGFHPMQCLKVLRTHESVLFLWVYDEEPDRLNVSGEVRLFDTGSILPQL